jgi:hypothetical protein
MAGRFGTNPVDVVTPLLQGYQIGQQQKQAGLLNKYREGVLRLQQEAADRAQEQREWERKKQSIDYSAELIRGGNLSDSGLLKHYQNIKETYAQGGVTNFPELTAEQLSGNKGVWTQALKKLQGLREDPNVDPGEKQRESTAIIAEAQTRTKGFFDPALGLEIGAGPEIRGEQAEALAGITGVPAVKRGVKAGIPIKDVLSAVPAGPKTLEQSYAQAISGETPEVQKEMIKMFSQASPQVQAALAARTGKVEAAKIKAQQDTQKLAQNIKARLDVAKIQSGAKITSAKILSQGKLEQRKMTEAGKAKISRSVISQKDKEAKLKTQVEIEKELGKLNADLMNAGVPDDQRIVTIVRERENMYRIFFNRSSQPTAEEYLDFAVGADDEPTPLPFGLTEEDIQFNESTYGVTRDETIEAFLALPDAIQREEED